MPALFKLGPASQEGSLSRGMCHKGEDMYGVKSLTAPHQGLVKCNQLYHCQFSCGVDSTGDAALSLL